MIIIKSCRVFGAEQPKWGLGGFRYRTPAFFVALPRSHFVAMGSHKRCGEIVDIAAETHVTTLSHGNCGLIRASALRRKLNETPTKSNDETQVDSNPISLVTPTKSNPTDVAQVGPSPSVCSSSATPFHTLVDLDEMDSNPADWMWEEWGFKLHDDAAARVVLERDAPEDFKPPIPVEDSDA